MTQWAAMVMRKMYVNAAETAIEAQPGWAVRL